jgi:hypothetical protein
MLRVFSGDVGKDSLVGYALLIFDKRNFPMQSIKITSVVSQTIVERFSGQQPMAYRELLILLSFE